MKNSKVAIVEDMVAHGYALMNRTIESMVEDFTEEQLQSMHDYFLAMKSSK